MTIDPGSHDGPPTIDIRKFDVSTSSLPRLLVGIAVALAVLGGLGWLVIGSAFGAPWFVAIPMSIMFGAGFVAWQVTSTWRGRAVSAVLWLAGLAYFAWWWVEHNL